MKKNDLLIIIPAYNEEKNIVRVVEKLKENYKQYDYIVINDGSKDRTAEICYQKKYPIIDLPVNLGLAGGFQAGMKYAYWKKYKYAIQFDADGQHLPQYIGIMLKTMKDEKCDIVIGSRFVERKKEHSMRMLGSALISGAIKISTGKKIKDPTSGMRLYNSDMIKKFALSMNYGPEPDTISHLIRNGIQIKEVQVEMAERLEGESYLNFTKSIMYMIRMFCSIVIVQNFRKKEEKVK